MVRINHDLFEGTYQSQGTKSSDYFTRSSPKGREIEMKNQGQLEAHPGNGLPLVETSEWTTCPSALLIER